MLKNVYVYLKISVNVIENQDSPNF